MSLACSIPPGTARSGAGTHLHDHFDGGQRGAKVLGVWGPHRHRHTATVQAAIEGGDEVHPWEGEQTSGGPRGRHPQPGPAKIFLRSGHSIHRAQH